MKKYFVIIFFIIFNNTAFADIDINNCDDLTKKSEKINCLTKLKAKALKENSSEKAKLIQNKLSKLHIRIGDTVENTEKSVASTGKKIGNKISETDKGIREKSKKTYDLIKNKFKTKE